MLSTVSSDHQYPYLPASTAPGTKTAFMSEERGREAREHASYGLSVSNQNFISRWLEGSRGANSQGPLTPPTEMTAANANPMLAPTYGGLYNSVPAVKLNTSQLQTNIGNYAGKSMGQPGHVSATQAQSPSQTKDAAWPAEITARRRSSSNGNQIVSYLQIPATINDSKGSLAEFAAQITCLFWFESSFTLHRVEESKIVPMPTTPLVSEAIPTMGFRKWVTTILSTTQVTQNVILLALMFIYRLKKLNPTVKGKPGSEFRLLTVALMLGNKFLDDNTYTNKTWAEVSGISVQEIHIMEVEFLSNMRYTLYASDVEWSRWHQKLGRFWTYFDKASKTPPDSMTKPLGYLAPLINAPPTLPSPPASQHASPPFLTSHSPHNPAFPHPLSIPPYLAPAIPSPVAPMPEVDLRPTARKRSYDDATQEPPAKRMIRSLAPPPISSMNTASTALSYAVPRLPVPNLSISTNHGGSFQGSYSAHLPPPTGRSMSAVYPGANHWSQSGNLSTPPSLPPSSLSSLPPMTDQTLRQPLYSAGSRNNSPTSTVFPQSSQDLLSPSGYPTLRNSPYKPLRGVNTLLVPPPSASLHNPTLKIGQHHMHYQPLGRPMSERKTGVVPYMHHDAWQQPQQVPLWPSLPQPNFQS
ncbi:hypothetical protein MMC06_001899 [Schaereria dolodes]|nr:hypothetical protein [Schaereria dolodes]